MFETLKSLKHRFTSHSNAKVWLAVIVKVGGGGGHHCSSEVATSVSTEQLIATRGWDRSL